MKKVRSGFFLCPLVRRGHWELWRLTGSYGPRTGIVCCTHAGPTFTRQTLTGPMPGNSPPLAGMSKACGFLQMDGKSA